MADTLTLAQLRTRVRERADMVNSQFVTDTELNGYINYSYKALYDLLVEAAEDYNLSSTTSTITTGNTIALPSDFYKLRGIDDLSDTNYPKTVRKFNWNERNDYISQNIPPSNVWDYSDVVYRVAGSNIIIMPEGNAAKTYKIWYVPGLPTLALDGDLADGVQGWLEYVIVDSAIKCLIKEESDITPLAATKAELVERIARLRNNRDQAQPEKISRIRSGKGNRLVGYDVGGYR